MNYDLKGLLSSLVCLRICFSLTYFCLKSNLIKTYMNANNIKTLIFHKFKFYLKVIGHVSMFKNQLYLIYIFCLKSDLIKLYMNANIIEMQIFYFKI